MRIVDPTQLTPLVPLPLDDEEARAAVLGYQANRRRFSQRSLTEEQEAGYLEHLAMSRGDQDWLRANVPVGSVFDVLGVAHMVVAIEHIKHDPERRQTVAGWVAVVVRPAPTLGHLERDLMTPLLIKAAIEPGFVIQTQRQGRSVVVL